MLKTKIEVLIDKMELVLEEAGNQLTDVDKRLIKRYASQIVTAVDQELPLSHKNAKHVIHSSPNEREIQTEERIQPNQTENLGKKGEQDHKVVEKVKGEEKEEELGARGPAMKEETVKEEKKEEVFGFLHPRDEEKKTLEKNEAAHKDISQSLEAIKKANEKKMALLQEEEENTEDDASLNDRFKKEEPVLIDRLKDKPISSLQLEIDLNEKFWFINELFNGNSATFNRLLTALDEAEDVHNARSILQNALKDTPRDNGAVKKLEKLIERRFL